METIKILVFVNLLISIASILGAPFLGLGMFSLFQWLPDYAFDIKHSHGLKKKIVLIIIFLISGIPVWSLINTITFGIGLIAWGISESYFWTILITSVIFWKLLKWTWFIIKSQI
jgi:ABC-type enterochelin transport system permease subunit